MSPDKESVADLEGAKPSMRRLTLPCAQVGGRAQVVGDPECSDSAQVKVTEEKINTRVYGYFGALSGSKRRIEIWRSRSLCLQMKIKSDA